MEGTSHQPLRSIAPTTTATTTAPTTTTAAHVAAPPGSPMGITFDFELPPSAPDLFSPLRPLSPPTASPLTPTPALSPPSDAQTITPPIGPAAAKKPHGGLHLLPHIPPVAVRSNSSSARRIMSGESQETGWNADDSLGREAEGSAQGSAHMSAAPVLARSKSKRLSSHFELDLDLALPQRAPLSGVHEERPRTAHGSVPRMEASLFPKRSDTPVMPPTPSPTLPSMNRSFIDSRDKPYSQAPKPFATLQGNHSSPDLLSSNGPVSLSHGPTPMYGHRTMSPQASVHDLGQRSNYSGSTARPSTHASSRTAVSAAPPPPITTIGTPYGATADSFPLPQHVKTRPRTSGVTSSVAGVTVPTHHTSGVKSTKSTSKQSSKQTSKQSSKSESRKSEVPKKKGRLLNPIFLLQRRRSSQDPDAVEAERANREAQAQAIARQRDVLASGVNIPPPDFDPRIKGKLVHDFSAPREKRNTFGESDMPPFSDSQGSHPPMSPSFPPRHASLVNRGLRDGQRRSTHTPVFRENLDEDPETSKRLSSIRAENLENKDFLQRASKHSDATGRSQESAVLPPFARRSQMLDPTQASFFHDDDSPRSSDPSSPTARDPSPSEVGDVSPATARSSGNDAISPMSASATSPLASRPVSHNNAALAQDRLPTSEQSGSKKSVCDSQRGSAGDGRSRPYSVVLAPPQIDTVADGSRDSSPVESPGRRAGVQEPRYLVRGFSIRGTPSPGAPERVQTPSTPGATGGPRGAADMTAGLPTPDHTPKSVSDASPKLVEKRKSATGHSRRSSAIPKKHASNASRFSFQFGGESAAEEQALEDKHRKKASREITEPVMRGEGSGEEDEDDYFDEDAIYDMDELEMQTPSEDEPQSMLHPQSKPGDGAISNAGTSQSSLYLQQARDALRQPESDDGSMYDDDEIPQVTDERDLTYADHPAFRAHSAMGSNSRHNSMMTDNHDGYWRDSTIDSYMRDSYYPSAGPARASRMTLSTSPGQPGGYAQDYLSAIDRDSQRFSRPQSTLNVPGQTSRPRSATSPQRPVLPHRDSGNSERNRAVSGFSFSTPGATPNSERVDPLGDGNHRARVVSGMSEATISDKLSYPHSHTTSLNVLSSTEPQSGVAPDSAPPPSSTDVVVDTSISTKGDFSNEAEISRGSADVAASPEPGKTSHPSASTDLSFDDFARSGYARGTSPTSPSDGRPPVSNTKASEPSHIADTSMPSSTGLGLSSFADFDFGQQFTGMITETTIGDASDSENELQKAHTDHGPAPSVTQAVKPASDGEANPSSTQTTTNTSSALSGFGPSTEATVSSTSPATTAHTSPASSWIKSPQIMQQRFGSPPLPQSPPNGSQRFASLSSPEKATKSPTMPSASRNASNHFPAKASPKAGTQERSAAYDDSQDDMYFDDGNFGVDFGEAVPTAGGFDESAFDDDSFLYRPNAAVNAPHGYGHRQQKSDMSYESIGSDGPYPSFAVPNASKALARNSQMMLEDLPIQAPVDPKYIPQRNPSEDARRMGMSEHAPPAPVSDNGPEAFVNMQDSLQKYHAALAAAANRAASEGRFVRQASVASTVASTANRAGPQLAIDTQSGRDDMSMYSQNEDSGEIPMPCSDNNASLDRKDLPASQLPHVGYSPPKMTFDFGFDQTAISDMDDYDDDDLVAAANAEVLASDDEGFYGQEFDFYGRPRAGSNELQAMNGGYWGPDGDDGLQRNKSLREPNLTPITERSEFSTRNSFVAGMPGFGLPSTNGFGHGQHSPALSRMPITPLMEHDITSFDDLRRLRAQAFGGSNRSERSSSNRSSQHSVGMHGPTIDTTVGGAHVQYGSPPAQHGYSNGSSGSSNPGSTSKPLPMDAGCFNFHDSPQSATSSNGNSFALDIDSTPRRNTNSLTITTTEPTTVKRAPPRLLSPTSPKSLHSHSRSGSGADSINYVQEVDPEGSGRPRWVLERRRTSELGQVELVGRELVQGGWI